jgi:CelD/BcsL family acetyltransferase involved in cellulose biosynthesis
MTTSDIPWSVFDESDSVAPATGPFVTAAFLQTIWDHRRLWGGDDAELVIASGDGSAALQHRAGRIEYIGHEDLIDYRGPVGSAASLAKEVAASGPGVAFRFDSMPLEAADEVTGALATAGVEARALPHTVTAVLELPGTFDEYLTSIGKKERHETRRKRRRFEAALGAPRLVTYRTEQSALTRFIRLHRMAPGEKGEFMTPAMIQYFRALQRDPRWRIDALYGDDNRMVAAAMAWSDDSGYYLYNSAFDPSAGDASPGVVLVSMLVERAIEEALPVFDFLKGDEPYKFRLGASERTLYVVEGTV